jgi:aspartate/glutamate racemase
MDKYLTPTFGILGGMGALAGTSLGDRFMREAARRGAQADETFPRLVQLSLAPAGLDAHGLAGDQQQLRQELLAQLDILADIGVSCVLPACNSISALHLEHSYLRILDPVALAVAALSPGLLSCAHKPVMIWGCSLSP